MSIDKEKMLTLFDEFKATIVQLMDERDKLVSEAEEIRTSRREAEEKAWNAEEELKKAKTEIEDLQKAKDALEAKATTAEEELSKVKSSLDDTESGYKSEMETLRKERDELKAEMDQITSRLDRVSELYREASAEKEKLEEKVDVSDLLAIYITLIETVFGGKPHARVLYTLHNTGSAIPRKNIQASTGIMATAILKAIHDLRNADLVSYDETTQEVKLVKDIL